MDPTSLRDTTNGFSGSGQYTNQFSKVQKVKTNSLEHAGSSTNISVARVSTSDPTRLKHPRRDQLRLSDSPVAGASSGGQSGQQLPTPPNSKSSDPGKRQRSRSRSPQHGDSQAYKRHKRQTLPILDLDVAPPRRPRIPIGAKAKPPPSSPPPLPPCRSYHDFLLCARFFTPLVKPSPVFGRPPPPSPPALPSAASTSPPTHHRRPRPPPLFLASTSSPPRPPTSLPSSSSSLNSNFPESTWSSFRVLPNDLAHMGQEEMYNSDRDEWADGAEPHLHDIESIDPEFEDRNWEPWEWVEQRLKWKMNLGNDEKGFEMLRDVWSLGPMRRVEKAEREQKEERERRKEKVKEKVKVKVKREGKEEEEREPRRHQKEPFLVRLKRYYDIDEPFTDDSDIERELEEEPTVGLAALAKPLIRPVRDRKKRRRREGKAESGASTDEEE